jgi:T5SS/PEP-CTERM-associated repeat protein
MKTMQFYSALVAVLLGGLLLNPPARAQYTADYQTNIISGVTSNWVDNPSNPNAGYVVGSNYVDDALVINGGGVLSNSNGYIGYEVGANDNSAFVSDAGSAWSNNVNLYVGYSGADNELTISNSGAVYSPNSYLGYNSNSDDNVVLVSGTGSAFETANLIIGYSGAGNQLIIANSAVVYGGELGYNISSSNNLVEVNGTGSTWYGSGNIGFLGAGNQLIVTNGGTVYDEVGDVGGVASSSNNVALVTGSGSVWNNVALNVGPGAGGSNWLIIVSGGVVYDGYALVGCDGSSSNTVLVSGISSVWNNDGTLTIGEVGWGNHVTITNGGAVYDQIAYLGYEEQTFGNNASNSVFVSGSGSVWGTSGNLYIGYTSAGNQMTIADGGVVDDKNGYVGLLGGVDNKALVIGTGSVWNNNGDLSISSNSVAQANELIVTNGATVYDNNALVGGSPSSGTTGSVVWVAGNGATWWNAGNLAVGGQNEIGNTINIGAGGSVVASNLYSYGETQGSQYANGITVSGGALYVTNNLHDSMLNLNVPILQGGGPYSWAGMLTVNSGTVTVDSLIMTNYYIPGATPRYTFGGVNFNGGGLSTKSTTISNGVAFVVGNGTNIATLNLATGGSGIYSFGDGLTISSNAFLTGCGTIEGSVVVNPGGTVLANCDGTLAFTGIVTNNGTMQALNGSVLESYGLIVNNGVIDIRGGTTNFPGGFINNGIVITTNNFPVITTIQVVGSDVEISVKTGNGSTYIFEETTNLTGASWTPVIEFTGTGSVTTFIDPGAATLPQRFYRVGLVPSP